MYGNKPSLGSRSMVPSRPGYYHVGYYPSLQIEIGSLYVPFVQTPETRIISCMILNQVSDRNQLAQEHCDTIMYYINSGFYTNLPLPTKIIIDNS